MEKKLTIHDIAELSGAAKSKVSRYLNHRAAINDLHPFQGCPFSLLGTSAK